MTFPEIWHTIWTSAYERHLERQLDLAQAEIKELKQQNLELARAAMKLRIQAGQTPDPISGEQTITNQAHRRRVSFGQAKRLLENQESPQRSVNV